MIARREQPPCAQRCRSDLLSETAVLRQQELAHDRVAGTVRLAFTIPAATFFPLFSLNWIVYFLGYAFGVAQILE